MGTGPSPPNPSFGLQGPSSQRGRRLEGRPLWPAAAVYWPAGGGGTILLGESPGPALQLLPCGRGDLREESLASQTVLQRWGVGRRPGRSAERRTGGDAGRGRGERTGRGRGGRERRPSRERQEARGPPRSAGTEADQPASARGLTFPPASQWAGPAASAGLPRSLRAARLRPCRRWHGDSSQVCKLVPLSPGQGEPWRLANMTQENVC